MITRIRVNIGNNYSVFIINFKLSWKCQVASTNCIYPNKTTYYLNTNYRTHRSFHICRTHRCHDIFIR